MRGNGAIKHERSSGNVFADVGLPEDYSAKAELVARIEQVMAERQISQTQAAKLLGIDQPRVSALLRGKLDLFSLEKLMQLLSRLGNRIDISVIPSAERPGLRVVPVAAPGARAIASSVGQTTTSRGYCRVVRNTAVTYIDVGCVSVHELLIDQSWSFPPGTAPAVTAGLEE